MVRAFCDESYDGKQRVFCVAGYVGRDKDWNKLSAKWTAQCSAAGLKNGFHATDFEPGRQGDVEGLNREQRIALKIALTDLVASAKIVGFAICILIREYEEIRQNNKKALRILPKSPYVRAAAWLVQMISETFNEIEYHGVIAYVFDQREKYSGETKKLIEKVRSEYPQLAPRIGSVKYADRRKLVPLQIADNLAYESMKYVLNRKIEPRSDRKSFLEMKEKIGIIRLADRVGLEGFVDSYIEE